MIVINLESDDPNWLWAPKPTGVPSFAGGTSHLISQAAHALSACTKRVVGIGTLDPPGEGLANYLGAAAVQRLRRDASPAEAKAGFRTLARGFDLLLTDASVGYEIEDLDAIVKMAEGYANGAASVGAEPLVVIAKPLRGDGIGHGLLERMFRGRVRTVVVAPYSRVDEVPLPGSSTWHFPVPLLSRAYDPARKQPLSDFVRSRSLDDDGSGERVLARWLNNAARSEVLRWFFGEELTYRAK